MTVPDYVKIYADAIATYSVGFYTDKEYRIDPGVPRLHLEGLKAVVEAAFYEGAGRSAEREGSRNE